MSPASCRSSAAIGFAILLTLGVAARASAAPFESFSDIAASAVVVTPDPSGRSAVLEATRPSTWPDCPPGRRHAMLSLPIIQVM